MAAPTTRWQEAFDADLSDVFKVQGEIAANVARSLNVVLSGSERGDLAARPTSNLAAWDAYVKGMEILERDQILASRPAVAKFEQATALDPGFAQAWARSSLGHSFLFAFNESSPQDGEAARKAAERAFELAPGLPLSSMALAHYHAYVKKDDAMARELFSRALETAPDDVDLLLGAYQIEQRWDRRLELARRAEVLDPRSMKVQVFLAVTLVCTRRTEEARAVIDRGLAVAPARLVLIFLRVGTFLQDGDLAGARAAIAAAQGRVDPTVLVATFGESSDLDWVLDEAGRDLLLRLTPAAFKDDRATWGLTLAQAWSRRADTEKVREYAEEARKSYAANLAQDPRNAQNQALLGLSLAYLGRKDEAVREGEKAVALRPMADSWEGAYVQHLLVRIHILCGNHEKALDLLEPLMKEPHSLHARLAPHRPELRPAAWQPTVREALPRGSGQIDRWTRRPVAPLPLRQLGRPDAPASHPGVEPCRAAASDRERADVGVQKTLVQGRPRRASVLALEDAVEGAGESRPVPRDRHGLDVVAFQALRRAAPGGAAVGAAEETLLRGDEDPLGLAGVDGEVLEVTRADEAPALAAVGGAEETFLAAGREDRAGSHRPKQLHALARDPGSRGLPLLAAVGRLEDGGPRLVVRPRAGVEDLRIGGVLDEALELGVVHPSLHHVLHARALGLDLRPAPPGVLRPPPLRRVVGVDLLRRLAVEGDAVDLRRLALRERSLDLRPGPRAVHPEEADAELREDRTRAGGRGVDPLGPAGRQALAEGFEGLAPVGAPVEPVSRRSRVDRALLRGVEGEPLERGSCPFPPRPGPRSRPRRRSA